RSLYTMIIVASYTSLMQLLLYYLFFLFTIPPQPRTTLFPYTTLFRSSWPLIFTSFFRRSVAVATSSTFTKVRDSASTARTTASRSEEHTSELQSLAYLVCRLLLEKKNNLQARNVYPLIRNIPGSTAYE